MAYPNFTSWTKDRELRKVSEKVANMLASISTQAQRGSLPFVQLYVKPSDTGGVKFITKGQSAEQYNSNLNERITPSCSTATSGKFDQNEFDTYESTEIAVQFDNVGTVCFSQNGTYYQTGGKINDNLNLKVEGKVTKNYLIICSKVNAAETGDKCALTEKDGLEKPAHLVKWSRFGNISKFKLFVKKNKDGVVIKSGWTRQ